MKIRNVVRTDVSLPHWQLPSEKTERILERVKKLTRELREVRSELYRELSGGDGTLKKQLNTATSVMAGLSQFQAVADELRQLLWLRLGNMSESNSPAQDKADQAHLLQGGQRPHLLTPEIEQPAPVMEAGSFFDRLNLAIEGYMQNRGITPGCKRTKS